MKTAALAAYIQSRKMKFAGAPVTLDRILKMWQLPYDAQSETVDLAAISGVARYCKMTPSELVAAVEAMTPPAPAHEPKPAPVPLTTFATVQIPSAPASAPDPEPTVVIETAKPAPDPTAVMPQDQLGDLVAASRRSSPVIEAPIPVVPEAPVAALQSNDDAEIDVSFDDVEATPIPEPAVSDTKSADAKSSKSKNKRKKKS